MELRIVKLRNQYYVFAILPVLELLDMYRTDGKPVDGYTGGLWQAFDAAVALRQEARGLPA